MGLVRFCLNVFERSLLHRVLTIRDAATHDKGYLFHVNQTRDNSILETVSIFLRRRAGTTNTKCGNDNLRYRLCALFNVKSVKCDFEYHLVLPALSTLKL